LGTRALLVHYWTSAAARDVIQLSATVRGDRKHTIQATRFAASLATTTTGEPPDTRQLIDDRGQFVMTPPYSYTTSIEVPEAARDAATVTTVRSAPGLTLSIRLDLLIETSPGSGAYFRQSVADDVRLSCETRGTMQ
jgi:hypothetical protein